MIGTFQPTSGPALHSPDALRHVRTLMRPHHLGVRACLFEEGQAASSLFLVESGSLKLTRTTTRGRPSVLALLGPGDLVGELSLLDGQPRGATATTVTPTSVLELTDQAFDRWLAEEPGAAGLMLGLLARRMRRSNDVVSDMVFSDVGARVARTLLDLAQRFGAPDDQGRARVRHGLTQEELAQLVGAARETVNKSLAQYAARGWIELHPQGFTLVDAERLAARS